MGKVKLDDMILNTMSEYGWIIILIWGSLNTLIYVCVCVCVCMNSTWIIICLPIWGGAVAQSVEPATPGQEVPGSIPAVAARSLLVVSVSV